ncbi:MAG: hypothetical protein HRT38_18205 [Alteromonadaceae bacterium]|nr:hypothetical protein [Alteromonadaceae bacterium]
MKAQKTKAFMTTSKVVMNNEAFYQVLPNTYYKEEENYQRFWQALVGLKLSSREIPDFMTSSMAEIYKNQGNVRYFVPHWHQLAIETSDARSIRNMLQADSSGSSPRSTCRNQDMLRYIDIVLQSKNVDYANYVKKSCDDQHMCVNDKDEDDWIY